MLLMDVKIREHFTSVFGRNFLTPEMDACPKL